MGIREGNDRNAGNKMGMQGIGVRTRGIWAGIRGTYTNAFVLSFASNNNTNVVVRKFQKFVGNCMLLTCHVRV